MFQMVLLFWNESKQLLVHLSAIWVGVAVSLSRRVNVVLVVCDDDKRSSCLRFVVIDAAFSFLEKGRCSFSLLPAFY